ncbi:hypothetical protein I3760_08G065500 [Carya illinoinensis]|uniref:BZIP domain-containing protein n=1 Tax=Carya illinoinensis TaxID=32201 RepID=A0A922E9F7_CARIL|nr:hypothetical protein I3760_08G065500 [Carya illinoinensis]KAG2692709.1 hypothetical protein I3760_08G065500 [Carya illinoinensis]KAG6699379.1 hypothetical protein I3842_08G065200 [Carya illinoinensis]KAG6699380.1 hypothetical protein I3842_08G065200 [Carya illinoinensis]
MQNFNASQMGFPVRQLPQNLSPGGSENDNKRPGIPPSHTINPASLLQYSQFIGSSPSSGQWGSQNLSPGVSHSRSLSQPTFSALDSLLPPLSPLPYSEPSTSSLSDPITMDVSMEESAVNSHALSLPSPINGGNAFQVGEGLPPHRGHRRSNSDGIPLGFSTMIQSSPQLTPIGGWGVLDQSISGSENSGVDKPIQLVLKGELKRHSDGNNIANGKGEGISEGVVLDDLFNEFMNLENIDNMNSHGTEEKDMDSRANGPNMKGCDGSDNEVKSRKNDYLNCVQWSSSSFADEKREGKRIACGDTKPTVRHSRSVSIDSYMGNLHFDDESPKLPPIGTRVGQQSPSNAPEGNSTKYCMGFGNGHFNEAELEKIRENAKLAEIALSDPKRAKRVLANRMSAARSKDRKTRYTTDIEHKAQILQTENTTLSIEVTKLQRESTELKSENNELRFRLQAMEQESKLKNALEEALRAEVQHLRLSVVKCGGEGYLVHCMAQQLSIDEQMFQLQHPQVNHSTWEQHVLPQLPHPDGLEPQQENGDVAQQEANA